MVPPTLSANRPVPVVIGVIAGAIAVGVGVGFSLFGRAGGRTDVGGLEGLRSVQEQLRPIDACRMEFNLRTFGVGQDNGERIEVYGCTRELLPMPVMFPVPPSWPYRTLAFEAHRASTRERWSIEVDQSRIPFPDLVAAFQSIAPLIAAQYPALRAEHDAHAKKKKDDGEAAERERQRARQKAKESYPSR